MNTKRYSIPSIGQVFSMNFSEVSVIHHKEGAASTFELSPGNFAMMVKCECHGMNSLNWPPEIGGQDARFYVLRLESIAPLSSMPPILHDIAHLQLGTSNIQEWRPYFLLKYKLLGMLREDVSNKKIYFSTGIDDVSETQSYGVFKPSTEILNTIINGGVTPSHLIRFGMLRLSETVKYLENPQPVYLSMLDIRGKRTAMFGKTRLGKSNVVKLLVQGMLDVTVNDHSVGQLIFDVNGEYANDNPQDGGSIASSYASRCLVYYLTQRNESGTGKHLRFNLYEQSEKALEIMRELLPQEIATSNYAQTFLGCRLPSVAKTADLSDEQAIRQLRKIMLFWTILDDAGFEHDEQRLKMMLENSGYKTLFNPNFHQPLRLAAYQAIHGQVTPPVPRSFREMITEMKVMAKFVLSFENDPNLMRNGQFLFDLDELIMARFLFPGTGDGTHLLRSCLPFHSPHADNFITEVLHSLNEGKTVIVDLGSANEQIIRYFAKTLSISVFQAQEFKFVNHQLNDRYVQIYFEEAHMIFPPNSGNVIDVYSRFAKEGAKFNIGIVYSTQSPSTVNPDLLAQTENFFIGHLSSSRETQTLSTVQVAFDGHEKDIMRARSPGFMRMLAYSNRFLIPVQANRYTGEPYTVEAQASA